jgi:hypothetical protein
MLNDSIKTLAATPPPAHRRWKFKTALTAHAEINRLERLLGMSPSGLDFNLTAANWRIVQLEVLAAHVPAPRSAPPTMAVPPAPDAAARSQSLAEGLTGRARFNASCTRDAAAKPKAKSHPELNGRDRFSADARINATPQILSGNQNPIPAGLKGRARFAAAVKADFAKKQENNKA